MERKTPSFSQLLHYINKGRVKGDEYFFKHNIYGNKSHDIVHEFIENSRVLKKRKNGNILYHHIVSIKHQAGYTKEELREITRNTGEEYTKAIAGNCLAYAVIHEQHNQAHMHIMFSANEISNTRPHYFSQAEFEKIKTLTKEYAYNKYPKLEQKEKAHEKTETQKKAKGRTKTHDNEYQLKKRTGKKTDKESMRERLQGFFSNSSNTQSFIQTLQDEKVQIYKRGKTFGFLDETTGKKYRLKTLELENEFEVMNNRLQVNTDEKTFKQEGQNRKAFYDNMRQANHKSETHKQTYNRRDKAGDEKINEREKMHQKTEQLKEEFMKTGLDKAKEEAREKFIERMKEARKKQKEEKEKTNEYTFIKKR